MGEVPFDFGCTFVLYEDERMGGRESKTRDVIGLRSTWSEELNGSGHSAD